MPQRPGLFRRIWDAIRPPPERSEPPRPPPGGGSSPPRENPPGGYPPRESPFRDIWEDNVNQGRIREAQNRTGYSVNELFQLHTEILIPLATEEPRAIQLDMWEDYLSAFINGDMRHEEFFDLWGIDPADFNWGLWREAMGYSRVH